MTEIIVALDNLTTDQAIDLAKNLSNKVWGFKVNDLLVEHGVKIIKDLSKYGNVFADPKLHDIPNTVHNSVKRLANAGADLISVHLSGGTDMCDAAMDACEASRIVGITMLTSLSPGVIRTIYRGMPIERLTDIALKTKMHGIVCSAQELPYWNMFNFIKVVPGIRPFGSIKMDDQIRQSNVVKTDFLVIGRPIVEAKDPLEAVAQIQFQLSGLENVKSKEHTAWEGT